MFLHAVAKRLLDQTLVFERTLLGEVLALLVE